MKSCIFCGCTEIAACVGAGNRPCGWSGKFTSETPVCTACEDEAVALLLRYAASRTAPADAGADALALDRQASADPAARVLESPAIGEVVRERIGQLERFGHDPEKDAELPIDHLPRKAAEFAQIGFERIRGTTCERNIAGGRKKLIQTAALCLAAVDRLDALPLQQAAA